MTWGAFRVSVPFCPSDPLFSFPSRSVPRLGDVGPEAAGGERPRSHAAGRRLAGGPSGTPWRSGRGPGLGAEYPGTRKGNLPGKHREGGNSRSPSVGSAPWSFARGRWKSNRFSFSANNITLAGKNGVPSLNPPKSIGVLFAGDCPRRDCGPQRG